MRISRRACLLGGAAGLAAFPLTRGAAQEKKRLDEAELKTILEAARGANEVPGLAAGVVREGKYAFGAAVGVRKAGDKTPATINDCWHLGSMTKSMTATLCGIFAERGKLSWDATLAETFPDLAAAMLPEYRTVTLKMLLAQYAGMSAESYPNGYAMWELPANFREPRLEYVRQCLKEPPASPPGSAFLYSNRNYMIAGALLERVSGDLWENLMTKHLFKPLGMKSAGFGAAGTPEKVDQPWGHLLEKGKRIAVEPGLRADNAPALGPAGRVHCSLPDLAKFVGEHLRGERGEKGLLKAETMKFLHTPPYKEEYMAGWMRIPKAGVGGAAYWHNGSNTMNYSLMTFSPFRNFAILVATNQAGDRAEKICSEVTIKSRAAACRFFYARNAEELRAVKRTSETDGEGEMTDTFERAQQLLVKALHVPAAEVTPDAALVDDLGADSIALVEIAMGLEEQFGIPQTEDEFERSPFFRDPHATVRQLVDYIEMRKGVGNREQGTGNR